MISRQRREVILKTLPLRIPDWGQGRLGRWGRRVAELASRKLKWIHWVLMYQEPRMEV